VTARPAASTGDPPPPAPGSLTDAPELLEIDAYLTALLGWRDRMRATLDRLEARARAATGAADVMSEVLLAYSLWQSISARVDRLVEAWDGGRVGEPERERIAQLVWGRLGRGLDVTLAVSFAEACVLADALVARLHDRLDADPMGAAGVGDRIEPLREQLARCDAHEPTGAERAALDDLARRLDAAVEAARRGEDVRDELAAIDAAASRLERDLIVADAVRGGTERDAATLRRRLDAVRAAAVGVRDLAARCRDRIDDAPRLAVPDPDALGPVPATGGDWRAVREALDRFEDRLGDVERALAEAQRRFEAPLTRRQELRGLLDAYRDMAKRRGHAEDAALQAAYDRARRVLYSAPLELDAGAAALAEYERAVRAATGAPRGAPNDAEGSS
jgi:hypothetical protein